MVLIDPPTNDCEQLVTQLGRVRASIAFRFERQSFFSGPSLIYSQKDEPPYKTLSVCWQYFFKVPMWRNRVNALYLPKLSTCPW